MGTGRSACGIWMGCSGGVAGLAVQGSREVEYLPLCCLAAGPCDLATCCGCGRPRRVIPAASTLWNPDNFATN